MTFEYFGSSEQSFLCSILAVLRDDSMEKIASIHD